MRSYLTSVYVIIAFSVSAFGGETVIPLKDSKAAKASTLAPRDAAQLAASLANSVARKRYGVAPFSASRATPRLIRGQWHWQATAGRGRADLLASVSFSQSGTDRMASVSELVLPQW